MFIYKQEKEKTQNYSCVEEIGSSDSQLVTSTTILIEEKNRTGYPIVKGA